MVEPEVGKKERRIEVIAADVCRSISTSQVVVTLSGACKELVDNGIDAGATTIEIRVKSFGYESLEVSDDGFGIKSDDFVHLCKPHATSKLGDISDFRSLATFGFRGEALNALCALSKISVTTRHKSEDVGTRLSFDHHGKIVKEEKCARPIGTTVTVQNLFEPLPVRRKEFERTSRKEFNKLLIVVQSFALSRTDVRFCVSSTTNGKRHQLLLSPGGNASIKDVIVSLFGVRAEKGAVLDIVLAEPDEAVCTFYSVHPEATFKDIRLSGYVSSCEHGHGRNSNDRQFIYFNKRPVDYPKLCRVANEVYQQYNAGQYCMLVLFVDVLAEAIDVNVSPDKRSVFFEREKELFALLRSSLLATFAPLLGRMDSVPTRKAWEKERQAERAELDKLADSQETLQDGLTSDMDASATSMDDLSTTASSDPFLVPALPKRTPAVVTYRTDVYSKPEEAGRKRQSEDHLERSRTSDAKRVAVGTLERFSFKVVPHIPSDGASTCVTELRPSGDGIAKPVGDALKNRDFSQGEPSNRVSLKNIVEQTTKSDLFFPTYEDEDFVHGDDESTSNHRSTPTPPTRLPQASGEGARRLDSAEDNSSTCSGHIRTQQLIPFSMRTLKERVEELHRRTPCVSADGHASKSSVQRESFLAMDPQLAETELAAYVTKEDFEHMDVVGQFNKGFIICRLGGDLFIVDQHASDEKFNFEKFQKKARIQSQALLRPLTLGLGAFDESLLRDHLDVFNYNGFEFQINEEGEPGNRVFLTSIPVLHNWQFNTSDIDEMLSVLREFPGTMYRPAKLRKLFALRACRKSVMIGTALNASKMEKIVRHLGGLDHPWNCPHGRPTLRHLCTLKIHSAPESSMPPPSVSDMKEEFRANSLSSSQIQSPNVVAEVAASLDDEEQSSSLVGEL